MEDDDEGTPRDASQLRQLGMPREILVRNKTEIEANKIPNGVESLGDIRPTPVSRLFPAFFSIPPSLRNARCVSAERQTVLAHAWPCTKMTNPGDDPTCIGARQEQAPTDSSGPGKVAPQKKPKKIGGRAPAWLPSVGPEIMIHWPTARLTKTRRYRGIFLSAPCDLRRAGGRCEAGPPPVPSIQFQTCRASRANANVSGCSLQRVGRKRRPRQRTRLLARSQGLALVWIGSQLPEQASMCQAKAMQASRSTLPEKPFLSPTLKTSEGRPAGTEGPEPATRLFAEKRSCAVNPGASRT